MVSELPEQHTLVYLDAHVHAVNVVLQQAILLGAFVVDAVHLRASDNSAESN